MACGQLLKQARIIRTRFLFWELMLVHGSGVIILILLYLTVMKVCGHNKYYQTRQEFNKLGNTGLWEMTNLLQIGWLKIKLMMAYGYRMALIYY